MPPFHHIDRLHSIEPDRKVLDEFRDGKKNICMIGRVSPNKGHPALIEAFAAYHHEYDRNTRLIIVGKEESRLAKYSMLLRQLIQRLELKDSVVFAGEVSDQELKAYYVAADIFMITSHHEGFCVPLVEAMAMRVPIVGYAATAIPETVGNAGLVWEERNPYLLAESIEAIFTQKPLGETLTRSGWERYSQHFTNTKIEEAFLDGIQAFL